MKGLIIAGASALCLILIVGGYFAYMAHAFPETKCEAARHLAAGAMEGDCYGCHAKATPRVAQEWYESKHGIMLVRCQTCHGQPDGQGAVMFTRSPGVEICAKCHSLAMDRMEAKFGRNQDCNTCHPHHQSAMHATPFQYRTPAPVAGIQAAPSL